MIEEHPDEATKEELDPALAEKALGRVRAMVRGNGLNPADVSLEEHDGSVLEFDAVTRLKLGPKIAEKTIKGRHTGGEVVASVPEVQKAITREIDKATKDPGVAKMVFDALMKRADKGYFLQNFRVPLNKLQKDFVRHDGCSSCNASGKVPCPNCKALGYTPCKQCRGEKYEICPECRGIRFIQGPNGQTKCHRCHGQGRISCTMCRQTGQIDCKFCKRTGKSVCKQCDGAGWMSYITHFEMHADTFFEYDRENLPESVIPYIEQLGAKLHESGHAEIQTGQAEETNNEIVIPYHLKLPWGGIAFKFGEDPVKARLFGYNGKLVDAPPFLEKYIAPGINNLEQAAQGHGNIAKLIHDAGTFRTVADAIIAAAMLSRKKGLAMVRKNTPLGIEVATIQKMIVNADAAIKHITRTPRIIGLVIGLIVSAVLESLYVLGPLRPILSGALSNNSLMMVADAALIALSGYLAVFIIQTSAQNAMNTALKDVLKKAGGKKIPPKTGNSGLIACGGSAVIFLILLELSIHTGPAAPEWYASLRQ